MCIVKASLMFNFVPNSCQNYQTKQMSRTKPKTRKKKTKQNKTNVILFQDKFTSWHSNKNNYYIYASLFTSTKLNIVWMGFIA